MDKDVLKRRIEKGCFLFIVILVFLSVQTAKAAPQGIGRYPVNPHAAVIRNAQLEARLPSYLKNPFYQDPRTARALAYSSRLTPGEMPVYTREAEKIPRREIYNVLVHAGFIPRQRSLDRLQYLKK